MWTNLFLLVYNKSVDRKIDRFGRFSTRLIVIAERRKYSFGGYNILLER